MQSPGLAYLAVAKPQRKSEGRVEFEWGPMISMDAMYESREDEERRNRVKDAVSGKSTAGLNAEGRCCKCIQKKRS